MREESAPAIGERAGEAAGDVGRPTSLDVVIVPVDVTFWLTVERRRSSPMMPTTPGEDCRVTASG